MVPREVDAESLDRAFQALSYPYRRRLLSLVAEGGPRGVTEFSPEDPDVAGSESQTVAVYHNHLPKLAEAGYIEWDRDSHTVRRGPQFDEVAPLLRLMRDHRDELPSGWL